MTPDARTGAGPSATERPSVAAGTRRVVTGAPIVAAHFIGDTAGFVLGEQALLLVPVQGGEQRVVVHEGGILCAACDGERIITGGDDGRLVAVDASATARALAADAKRRWIDRVALGPNGAVAWSAGKTAAVRTAHGVERTLDVPSTVGGLAFAPKGVRLAVSHYNGVTLWFPNAPGAEPERFDWKGSHLAVTFDPGGRFLITAMQEPQLHGWRLADRKPMRMSGYSAKVRSMDWTADRKWLCSAGAEQLILWPFQSKDGPMGKAPRMLAPHPTRVVRVACHPREDVVAVGYADGLVLLVRVEDGAEILANKPGAAAVSALAWRADGKALAFGTEDGEAGIIDLA